jgi:hypothetical protein
MIKTKQGKGAKKVHAEISNKEMMGKFKNC